MKIAIVYDRVNKWGGAERVLLALHEIFPKAPLYTSVYSPDSAGWAKVFPEIKTSFLQRIPFAKNHHEFLAPFMPLAFNTFNFDEYDLVITVTSEFAKNINVRNGKHVCYCLTPTRYLWSHEKQYFNFWFLFFTKPMTKYLKRIDKMAAKKPDIMIAISTSVQKRIKKYYKRESKIIMPPIDMPHSSCKKLNNYYLIVSRLVSYKRINLAIEAFDELNLPLIIVGTGHEEKKLKKLAKKNIQFAGFVNKNDLENYYKNAKAFIFPQEEDFGITAVEAQSYGIPVIAYKAGGSLDTVIQNKTGVFFGKQNQKSLIEAIRKFEKIKFSRSAIVKNSNKFSKEKFKKEFLKLMQEL